MSRPSLRSLTTAALAATALACGDDDPSGPPAPAYREAVVEANPQSILAAAVRVRASGFNGARVRAFAEGDTLAASPVFGFEGDSVARVPVLGLLPGRDYALEVLLQDGAGEAAVDTVAFTTGALPAWIPPMTTTGDGAPGLVALSFPDGAVIIDNAGGVRWYRHSPNGNLNSFQAHSNGTYTILDVADAGNPRFRVLDLEGTEIGTLACLGWKTRFHDVLVLADGTAWLLCDDSRTMDLSGLGGMADALVTATVVQRRRLDGTVDFEWNAFDHFAITDLPQADRVGAGVNFTHGNAIALDAAGDLVLSFRSLNEVTGVAVPSGDVLWRLGGLAGQFTFANDPKSGFQRQHGVRVAGPSVIQMLDNGDAAPSRMARYLVNPEGGIATLIWAFVDAPEIYTMIGGSSQAIGATGGGLVSFGTEGRVVETDAAGNRRWEVHGTEGTYVFRAERIGTLYFP
jgi:hypothetical protein